MRCFCLILTFLTTVAVVSAKSFTIAWLAPGVSSSHVMNANTSVESLFLALDSAANNANIMKGHTISVKFFETDCTAQSALTAAMFARKSYNPDVFIGPPCKEGMETVASLATYWNLPVFSWYNPEMVGTAGYPTMMRMMPSVRELAHVLTYLLQYHGWSKFAIMHDSGVQWQTLAEALQSRVESSSLLSSHRVHKGTAATEIEALLKRVKTYSRVIVFAVPWMDLRRYLLIASTLGMAKGGFVFISLDSEVYSDNDLATSVLSDRAWKRGDLHDHNARMMFQSVIHVLFDPMNDDNRDSNYTNPRNRHTEFVRLAKNAGKQRKQTAGWEIPTGGEPDVYSLYLYDAVLVWSVMVDMLNMAGKDYRDGHLLAEHMKHVHAEGATGYITMNNDRERIGKAFVITMDSDGQFSPAQIIRFNKTEGFAVHNLLPETDILRWRNGTTDTNHSPSDVIPTQKCPPIERPNRRMRKMITRLASIRKEIKLYKSNNSKHCRQTTLTTDNVLKITERKQFQNKLESNVYNTLITKPVTQSFIGVTSDPIVHISPEGGSMSTVSTTTGPVYAQTYTEAHQRPTSSRVDKTEQNNISNDTVHMRSERVIVRPIISIVQGGRIFPLFSRKQPIKKFTTKQVVQHTKMSPMRNIHKGMKSSILIQGTSSPTTQHLTRPAIARLSTDRTLDKYGNHVTGMVVQSKLPPIINIHGGTVTRYVGYQGKQMNKLNVRSNDSSSGPIKHVNEIRHDSRTNGRGARHNESDVQKRLHIINEKKIMSNLQLTHEIKYEPMLSKDKMTSNHSGTIPVTKPPNHKQILTPNKNNLDTVNIIHHIQHNNKQFNPETSAFTVVRQARLGDKENKGINTVPFYDMTNIIGDWNGLNNKNMNIMNEVPTGVKPELHMQSVDNYNSHGTVVEDQLINEIIGRDRARLDRQTWTSRDRITGRISPRPVHKKEQKRHNKINSSGQMHYQYHSNIVGALIKLLGELLPPTTPIPFPEQTTNFYDQSLWWEAIN